MYPLRIWASLIVRDLPLLDLCVMACVGLRALGFNGVFSVAVALAFHVLHASYWTSVRTTTPALLINIEMRLFHRYILMIGRGS